jgi:hypothetical protein
VEFALSNPTYKLDKSIKISMVRIKHRKYKSIHKKKHKIQPNQKENFNDYMRIYSVSTAKIHKQKYFIPAESKMSIAYTMKT